MIGKRGIWRGLALGCLLAAALPLVQPAASEAAGNIWMDENAEVQAKSFKKVVLFPVRYLDAPDGRRATTLPLRSASRSASSARTS